MLRVESGVVDASIPFGDYDNSVFIHGSTENKNWRNEFLAFFATNDLLVLDPWKTAWGNYTNALSDSIESYENLSSSIISGGTPGGGGVVPGAPPTVPDIANSPFFWENRNCLACDYQYFNFNSDEEIASHVVTLLAQAIVKDATKVIVRIPNEPWRTNISLFLKDLPRENYFGNTVNSLNRLKKLIV